MSEGVTVLEGWRTIQLFSELVVPGAVISEGEVLCVPAALGCTLVALGLARDVPHEPTNTKEPDA